MTDAGKAATGRRAWRALSTPREPGKKSATRNTMETNAFRVGVCPLGRRSRVEGFFNRATGESSTVTGKRGACTEKWSVVVGRWGKDLETANRKTR